MRACQIWHEAAVHPRSTARAWRPEVSPLLKNNPLVSVKALAASSVRGHAACLPSGGDVVPRDSLRPAAPLRRAGGAKDRAPAWDPGARARRARVGGVRAGG